MLESAAMSSQAPWIEWGITICTWLPFAYHLPIFSILRNSLRNKREEGFIKAHISPVQHIPFRVKLKGL